MTQVCEALAPVLSVSELSLQDYAPRRIPPPPFSDEPHPLSGGQNGLDSTTWHELLRPFSGVKRLDISDELAVDLSCALNADDARLIPWLLPELQEFDLNDAYMLTGTAFAAFFNTRQSAGRPVNSWWVAPRDEQHCHH